MNGKGKYKLNDKYFEDEIKSIRSSLREYKDNRKLFNAKISNIIRQSGVPDKKVPISSMGDNYESCLVSLKSIGISEDRSIEECSTQWKGEGTHVGVKQHSNLELLAIKQKQELSAQHGGTIHHVTARNAAVQQEQIVPAWLRSNLIHRSEIEHDIVQPTQQLQSDIKSAAIEDNRPAILKTRSRYVEAMGEHRYEQEVKPVEPAVELTPQQSKQASIATEPVDVTELHPYLKRIQNRFEGHFV